MMDLNEIGRKAWENLQNDKAFFSEVPPQAREIFEPFLVGFPKIAGAEIFEAPVNLESIVKTKLAFLRYALENDFIGKYMKAINMPDWLFAGLEVGMAAMVESLQEIALDAVGFMKERGLTEEQGMEILQMNTGLIQRAKNGMAIAELYSEAPALIVKNTD